jgi:hypothetical protein
MEALPLFNYETNQSYQAMYGRSKKKGDIYGFGGLKVPQLEQVF